MSYPKSLQYLAQRLNNYHRQSLRLTPRNAASGRAGSIISCVLPENSLVDLRTFSLHALASISASGTAAFPKHAECLIDRVSVDVNSVTVDAGCTYTNHLVKMLFDMTLDSSMDSIRNVGMLGGDAVAGTPPVNKPITICNWVGFLQAAPAVIDTSLTGPITVNVHLAQDTVLVTGSATSAAFYLDNICFTCDVVSIDDGVYNAILNRRLESGPIPITYPRWSSFMGSSSTSAATNLTFGVSSQSVDLLLGTLVNGGYNTQAANHYDDNTKSSRYFSRGAGDALQGSQFQISGVTYPSYMPTPMQAFSQSITALGINQSALGGADKNFDSYSKYLSSYFAHAVRLNHPGEEVGWISGLDTRGANVSMSYGTTGQPIAAGGSVFPLVFVASTASLLVGAYRQLQVTL